MIYDPQLLGGYSLKQHGFHEGETLERLGIMVEVVSPRRIAMSVDIVAGLFSCFISFWQYLQCQ